MLPEAVEQFIRDYPYLTIVLFSFTYPLGFLMLQYERTAWIVVGLLKFYKYTFLILLSVVFLTLPFVVAPFLIFAPWFTLAIMLSMFIISIYFVSRLWDILSD